MKKYLYKIVLAALILFSTTAVKASNEVYYTNKENVEMTEREYNNLLGLGFSEKYISKMTQEEFLENKDLEGTVISESTKYIKITTAMRNGIKLTTRHEITQEEALAEVELQSQNPYRGPAPGSYYDGIVATDVIAVTAKIVGINNTYMRFMNLTDWLIPPSDRYYDIIAIGIESDKVQLGSFAAFREDWTTSDGIEGYDITCYPKYENTGGSVIFELPSGSLSSLEATLYFNIAKQANVGTITSLYAGAIYAHGTSTVNPSTLLSNYTVNIAAGIEIDYPYNLIYNVTPMAVAHFVGTW